ncbi:MAG TPA: MFS transporter [Sandaracinaceae bacterium]
MALLFVALFNSILGLSVLFPILAPLGRQLGLEEIEITSLSTAYALLQFLTATYWGRRSEEKGRKPILLVGIVGFAVTFYAFGAVAQLGLSGVLSKGPLLVLLLATRIAGGALSSATLPTAQAYAADISERGDRTKAMGVIGAAFGLGVIFGPAIGAGLTELTGNLVAAVYFSASVAVVNAIFVALRLPEPERRAPAEPAPPGPRRSVVGRVWPFLAVGFGATLASVALEQTVAFYFQDRLALSEAETPRVVGVALVAYGVVAVLAQGLLVRRVSLAPLTWVRLGLPIGIAGFALFVFADAFALLTSALVLQGLGQGLLLPGVTSAASLAVGDEEQGTVAGMHGAAQALARTVGPIVGGTLYEFGHELPYAFGGALLALVLVLVLAAPRREAEAR